MSVVKTNLFMNWSGVTVTHLIGSTPTVIPITKVTDVSINGQSVQEMFHGDARQFAVLIRNVADSRSIKITSGDAGAVLTIPFNKPCTINAVLLDAINGAGPGAIAIEAINGMRKGSPVGGQNNKFASGNVEFSCYGNSDDEDPVTVTQVANT